MIFTDWNIRHCLWVICMLQITNFFYRTDALQQHSQREIGLRTFTALKKEDLIARLKS